MKYTFVTVSRQNLLLAYLASRIYEFEETKNSIILSKDCAISKTGEYHNALFIYLLATLGLSSSYENNKHTVKIVKNDDILEIIIDKIYAYICIDTYAKTFIGNILNGLDVYNEITGENNETFK